MASPKQSFNVVDLPVKQVSVFVDRAEVRRSIKCHLEAGVNEILVTDLSQYCDSDSIRVEGHGKATITEVSYFTKLQNKDGDSSHVIENEIVKLQHDISVLKAEKSRVEKKIHVINGISDQVANGQSKTSEAAQSTLNLTSDEGLSGITRFLTFYDDKQSYLDGEIFRIDREIKSKNDEIKLLRDRLSKHQEDANASLKTNRLVSVMLDVQEAGEINLILCYLTSEASWKPKYDIRAYVNDQNVKITYYGVIQQNTTEDWNNTKLYLSTATPSVGGDIPVLPAKHVQFVRPVSRPVQKRLSHRASRKGFGLMAAGLPVMSMSAYDSAPDFENEELEIEALTAEVESTTLSTMYEITRTSTIPSDNTEHKVTVALIDLKPDFEYITVPQKVQSAFLKAKLTNDSSYAILPGPSNVFVDNNFIGKASLPTVSPSEQFECSLGVDAAVRVTYLPRVKFDSSAGGLLSKSVVSKFKQVIEVKNTHMYAINIEVEDQLPTSTDEKIKVVLHSPTISKDDSASSNAAAYKNKKGNVVWRSKVNNQSAVSLELCYSIERPRGSCDIEYTED